MTKITISVHTASPDDFLLKSHGIESSLRTYIQCLNRQTMPATDFEFVYVDYYWPRNRGIIEETPHEFSIKYVPNVRDFWTKKGLVSLSSPKNAAICFSEGELVIQLDDSELFESRLLELYWGYFKKGLLAHTWHKRMSRCDVLEGSVVFPIRGDEYIQDHRRQTHSLKDADVHEHTHGGLLYAGTSFSMQDALDLNGFNERLDGAKALQDCEFGVRLSTLGRRFVLDRELFIWILDHKEVYTRYLKDIVCKDNYGFIAAHLATKETKANHRPLNPVEVKCIEQATLKYRSMAVNWDSPDVNDWLHYPTFSLAEERERWLNEYHSGALKYDALGYA